MYNFPDFHHFIDFLSQPAAPLGKSDLKESRIKMLRLKREVKTEKTPLILQCITLPKCVLALTPLIVTTAGPDLASYRLRMCSCVRSAMHIHDVEMNNKYKMSVVMMSHETSVCSRVAILIIACMCAAICIHRRHYDNLFLPVAAARRYSHPPFACTSLLSSFHPYFPPPFIHSLPLRALHKMRSAKTIWPLVFGHYLDDACSAAHLQLSRRHAHS